jgi:hypothetical protein
VPEKEPHEEEVRDPQPQQAPPQRQGPQRSEGRLTDPADSGWGEDWSEDVERTYDVQPPVGLTDRQLRIYLKLAWHSGRGGIIPSQPLLSEELDIPLRTLKRDIAALVEKGVLDRERRRRRGHRGGGRLKGGNRYFLKLALNDLPDELFPPRGHRTEGPTTGQAPSAQVAPRGHAIPTGHTEGPTGQVPSAQVTPRGQAPSWPLGDGGKAEETVRSDRGAKHVDNPRNAPTVSEEKPREERVSPQPSAQQSSAPGRPRFRTMAEEKAWAAARARLPPDLDDDIVWVLWKLQEAGMLEGSRVVEWRPA